MFKKLNLDSIFYPKSIAVIGASNNLDKIGGFIFSQILKQRNIKAIPINFKSDNIQGEKSYTSISKVNDKIDLVIISIPSQFVIDTVIECAKKKIKNLIIISAGFKETGEDGRVREEKLKEIIKKYKLNVIGPNCLGILTPEINLNCSFAKDIPSTGETALISQSGAVIDAIIDWSFKKNIGFSKIVSLGNMSGIDELSMLNYLKKDPKTKSIVFYMETLEKGIEFSKTLKEISKTKPVIIIKPGKSDNAKAAIGSHTGSLAQDNLLVRTLIEDNNGILVNSLNELFNILIGLKSKFNSHNDLTIVTNAGGPGVIATDCASELGFELLKFDNKQKSKFKLPNEASLNNPIDILGDGKSDRYLSTLKTLEKIKEVNNILILLTPQIMTDCENIAKEIVNFSKKSKKNIIASFIGDKEIKRSNSYLDHHNFPNFQTPNEAIVSMNYLRKYKSFQYQNNNNKLEISEYKLNKLNKKIKSKRGLLDYKLSKEILNLIGLEIFEKQIIKTKKDIFNLKLSNHKTYVIKIDGPAFIHKKDIGGVKVGISHLEVEDEVNKMYNIAAKISDNFSITIEEEIKGNEVIIGLKQDKELGNFILFGMGGTYVSIFKDINFSTCPLTLEMTKKLIAKSKVNKILKGFRGSKRINYKQLYRILIRLSYLQEIFPQIKEVDFNPVICNENGSYLVDVKLIVN